MQEIIQMLEATESFFDTITVDYTIKQVIDVDIAISFSQLLIDYYKDIPALFQTSLILQEYVDSLHDPEKPKESKSMFRAKFKSFSPGRFSHYIEKLYTKGEDKTLYVLRQGSFNGKVYKEFYPVGKQGVVQDTPLLTEVYSSPNQMVLCVGEEPLSKFVTDNNPQILQKTGNIYVIRCEKQKKSEYEGKQVVNINIWQFWLDAEQGFLPIRVEVGEGLEYGGEKKYEDMPRELYTVELKDHENGLFYPDTINVKYFKWIPLPDLDGVKAERHYKGIIKIIEVTDCKINSEAPESLYDIEFPQGTLVSDRILGIIYTKGQK